MITSVLEGASTRWCKVAGVMQADLKLHIVLLIVTCPCECHAELDRAVGAPNSSVYLERVKCNDHMSWESFSAWAFVSAVLTVLNQTLMWHAGARHH